MTDLIQWCTLHQTSTNPYDDDDSQCIAATHVIGVMSQCVMVKMRLIPTDALAIEKVDGEWPEWALRAVAAYGEVDEGPLTGLFRRKATKALDALAASRVGDTAELVERVREPTAVEAVQRAMGGEAVPYKGLLVGPGMTGLFPDDAADQVGESE